VTAFEGARNAANDTTVLRELTLHCAEPTLTDSTSVAIGTARPTQPMSADLAVSGVVPDEVLPLQSCPAGQVVRGVVLHAGRWVDGVRFVCGTPVVAQREGSTPATPSQTASP
jgi:hypothetical protein